MLSISFELSALPTRAPFWDTHTPPLHFNCRSTLRAIYDKEELPEEYAPIKNEKAYTPAKGFGSAPTKGDGWWEELSGMKAQAQQYGVQKEIEAAREKLISGGTSGGIMDKTPKAQQKFADDYYAEIRNRKSKSDIKKIAVSSGLKESEIRAIRHHLFEAKDLLLEENKKGGFTPDPEIALAWQRLSMNKPKATDILLLKHELYELTLMKEKGYTYGKAHLLADKKYPWEYKINKEWKDKGDDTIQKNIKDRLKGVL